MSNFQKHRPFLKIAVAMSILAALLTATACANRTMTSTRLRDMPDISERLVTGILHSLPTSGTNAKRVVFKSADMLHAIVEEHDEEKSEPSPAVEQPITENQLDAATCVEFEQVAEQSITANIDKEPISEPASTNISESTVADATLSEPSARRFSFSASQAYADPFVHDDGYPNEFEPGYFVAHRWSDIGEMFANLEVGDVVEANGLEVTIVGSLTRDFSDSVWIEVRDAVGWDKVCFQTCTSSASSDRLIVAYGLPSVPRNFKAECVLRCDNGAYISLIERDEMEAERAHLKAMHGEVLELEAWVWSEYYRLLELAESGVDISVMPEWAFYESENVRLDALRAQFEEEDAAFGARWAWTQ